eukprot:Skav218438  [mRNA]  locus=scaffold420:389285:390028:+ [translate_table: standard]
MCRESTLREFNKGNKASIECVIVLNNAPKVKVIVSNEGNTIEGLYDPQTSTIGDIKNAISKVSGAEPETFHLTFEGKPMPHYRRIAEYILEGNFNLGIVAGGLMGGGVKKAFLKTKKASKNIASDQALYEKAFNTALTIDTAGTYSLKAGFVGMSKESLMEVQEYLTADRSNYMTKLKNLHSFLPSYDELAQVQEKLKVAMETLQSLTLDDIDKSFGLEDSKEAVEGVKDIIKELIAVKNYQSSMQT